MSTAAQNKKFITLDNVRIYHNKKDNTIQLLSADEDIVGKPFLLTLKQGTDSEETIRNLMVEKGVLSSIPSDPYQDIPKKVTYPKDIYSPSGSIVIGYGAEAAPIYWDLNSDPHSAVIGPSGSGKTIFQRAIVKHCLVHKDWEMYGVDLKRVELTPYSKYTDTIKKVSTTLKDTEILLSGLLDEMHDRYMLLESRGLGNFSSLLDKGDKKNIMVVVDELGSITIPEREVTPAAVEANKLRKRCGELLDNIAMLGKAAGIHLTCSSQRLESFTFGSGTNLIRNLGLRISLGALNKGHLATLFGIVEMPQNDMSVRGRGIYSNMPAEVKAFHTYYLGQQNLEK